MLLSNTNFEQLLGTERGFGISPYDPSRVRTDGYTVSVGSRLVVPRSGRLIVPGVTAPNANTDTFILGDGTFHLAPGEFAAVSILEVIRLSQLYAGRIVADHDLALTGLGLAHGPFAIGTGEHADYMVPISNEGPSPVELRLGMPLATLQIERLLTPATVQLA